jgi:predicted amidohydrolase YtcJ
MATLQFMGFMDHLLKRPCLSDKFGQMLIEFRSHKSADWKFFRNISYFLFLTILPAILSVSIRRAHASEVADLVLFNGKIVTVDENFAIVQALAVKDGRVSRIGTDREVLETKGDRTELVDLGGKMVLPGLMDSHTHPTSASMFEFDHPVPDMESIDDVLEYVRSRTEAVAEGSWITLNQVFITRLREQRYPTCAELDRVAPRHPVVFRTGPDAAVNSLALRLSNIDASTNSAAAGIVEKDPATGEPTGILRGEATKLLKVSSDNRPARHEDHLNRLKALFKDYNSVGITSIADRNADPDSIARYLKLRDADQLTVRIAVSHAVSPAEKISDTQARIREVAKHPLCQGDERLRIVGIKMFQDGGMLTGSAYMREPWGISRIYSISDPQYRGMLFIEKADLREYVRTAVECKLQFTAHSVGDGAVHNLVDVYDDINKSICIRSTRPCITHCNFMSREAIERMAQLGVVCDIQPAWLYLDARTLEDQFGYDRMRWFQPLKSMFESGVIAGGGSDHMQKIGSLRSVNPYNPFLGMWITITRQAKRYDGQMHSEEALSREQAIRLYTTNNAYLLFLDSVTGSLEEGKSADMIVLDRDLLTCPVDEIKLARVLRTYLGGRLVHMAQAQ